MFVGTKKFVLIALFTALLIILVNLAWWFYYQKTESLLETQLARRLSALAGTAALAFQSNQVENLTAGDVDAYLTALALLQGVCATDSLAEAFVLAEDHRYLLTTVVEPDSLYFLADLNSGVIDSLFFGLTEQPLVTPTYPSGNMFLKSAFAPLFDRDGLVIAVLGLEANVDYFDALRDLRSNLYYASGLSLAGGLLLGLLFLLLQRRINRAEQQLFMGDTHAHLGRMVAVVAHELKNPLMIIRGSAERIAKKTDLPEAAYVIEEIDRLNGIVTGYLDFAKSGGSLLANDQLQTVRLDDLMSGVRKHLADKYRDESIQWLESAPCGLDISTYPRSLRQVLLNLLINGVETCREAGKPIMIGLAACRDDDSVRITVTDRGAGIGKKDLKRIFTPFHTTRPTGSGLGLYLSKRIINQMGGAIRLSSILGETTTVEITLPLNPRH